MVAPNFQNMTTSQEMFDLYQYQGSDFLLLIFYRGSWCNACRDQLRQINQNYDEFQKLKTKIVAISSDTLLNTSLLANLLQSKFPLLSDTDFKIFELYNLPKFEDKKKIIPALFLVNQKHEIIYSYIGKDYKDRPDTKELLNIIKEKINSSHPS